MKFYLTLILINICSYAYSQISLNCNNFTDVQFVRVSPSVFKPNIKVGNYIKLIKYNFNELDSIGRLEASLELYEILKTDSCDFWANIVLYHINNQEATSIYAIFLSFGDYNDGYFSSNKETLGRWRTNKKEEDIAFWRLYLKIQ